MNIWFVHQYAIPRTSAGMTRHFDFAESLVDRGHKVSLITSSFNQVKREETVFTGKRGLWKNEDIDGVGFFWVRGSSYESNNIRRIWNLAEFAWRVYSMSPIMLDKLGRPDVIVGSSPHLTAALAGEQLAAMLNVPFILEVRDLWPETLVQLGGYKPSHPMVRTLGYIESFLYKRATKIISALPNVHDHMVARGAKKENIIWIPNGVILDRIPEVTASAPEADFTFVYAGLHGVASGLETVIEAAAILAKTDEKIKIKLIGDGPNKTELMAKAQAYGLNNISFSDPVPKTGIYTHLLAADAFLLSMLDNPLYKKGISVNKLFDYLACQRPIVLASDAANNPVMDAGAGLTVPPNDAAALAQAMIAISHEPLEKRQAMGAAGRSFVTKNQDIKRLASTYEAVLYSGLPPHNQKVLDV